MTSVEDDAQYAINASLWKVMKANPQFMGNGNGCPLLIDDAFFTVKLGLYGPIASCW
jgi:hypothetical protein